MYSSWDEGGATDQTESILLYATMLFTLWMEVVKERKRTSSDWAMICGPDSSHFSGTTRSLSVYTRRSNAPGEEGTKDQSTGILHAHTPKLKQTSIGLLGENCAVTHTASPAAAGK